MPQCFVRGLSSAVIPSRCEVAMTPIAATRDLPSSPHAALLQFVRELARRQARLDADAEGLVIEDDEKSSDLRQIFD